ncbi:hypothetical protein P9112_012678 [Eukaryota sp. TZLM1-RC]
MSSASKKDLQPGQRIALIVRFLFGNCISPRALFLLLLLFLTLLGSVAAIYSLILKHKLLSFVTFIFGFVFFFVFFAVYDLFLTPLGRAYKENTAIAIVITVALSVFGFYTATQLVWLLNWLTGFFVGTFIWPYGAFGLDIFGIPCSDGGRCHIYHNVDWGEFTFEYYMSLAMLFSLQIYVVSAFFYLVVMPVIANIYLFIKSIIDVDHEKQFFDCDKPPSRFLNAFKHVFCITFHGKLAWIVNLSIPSLFIAFHSIVTSFTHPVASVILQGILIISVFVCAGIYFNNYDVIDDYFEGRSWHPVKVLFYIGYYQLPIVSAPFILGWLGFGISLVIFLIDPNLDQIVFVKRKAVSEIPNFVTLLLCILNCVVYLVLLALVFGLVFWIVRSISGMVKSYKQFEEQYLLERGKEAEKPVYC